MQAFSEFNIWGRKITDKETIEFSYSFDKLDEIFSESMRFPGVNLMDFSQTELKPYCDPLAIAAGVSYYKLFPVSNIIVHHTNLTDGQEHYRKKLYQDGLGEFYYTNKIDPRTLQGFSTTQSIDQSQLTPIQPDKTKNPLRTLVMWGGGKDSIVSYELIQQRNNGVLYDDTNHTANVFKNALQDTQPTQSLSLFTFGRRIYQIHSETAKITKSDHLFVERTLPIAQFKKRSDQGYYSGHVSITALISFVSLLVSKLYEFSEVVLSAEKSADSGNLQRKGMTINHQRSKSNEAIGLFQDYAAKYINPEIAFVNPFGDAYEREIVQDFSRYKKYFGAFSSCNRNFHVIDQSPDGRWCKTCPKCLFVYIILRPFISAEDVETIWGEELYANISLLPLAEQIWGFSGSKPFECVGTADESQAMTQKFIEKNPKLATLLPVTKAFIGLHNSQGQK